MLNKKNKQQKQQQFNALYRLRFHTCPSWKRAIRVHSSFLSLSVLEEQGVVSPTVSGDAWCLPLPPWCATPPPPPSLFSVL